MQAAHRIPHSARPDRAYRPAQRQHDPASHGPRAGPDFQNSASRLLPRHIPGQARASHRLLGRSNPWNENSAKLAKEQPMVVEHLRSISHGVPRTVPEQYPRSWSTRPSAGPPPASLHADCVRRFPLRMTRFSGSASLELVLDRSMHRAARDIRRGRAGQLDMHRTVRGLNLTADRHFVRRAWP